MRIDIQTHGFDLTEGLRQHTERRLQFALSWANHDIRSVSVDLSDVNGARGGPGKRCRIQIPLPRVQPVVIEEDTSGSNAAWVVPVVLLILIGAAAASA